MGRDDDGRFFIGSLTSHRQVLFFIRELRTINLNEFKAAGYIVFTEAGVRWESALVFQ